LRRRLCGGVGDADFVVRARVRDIVRARFMIYYLKKKQMLNTVLYTCFWVILVVLFSWGCAVYATFPMRESYTSPDDPQPPSCPDILVQKGNAILLYNSGQSENETTNPLVFSSMDEYTTYVEQQRANGIQCPLLYLTQETTTQGRDIYRARSYPLDDPIQPSFDNSSQFRRDLTLASPYQQPTHAANLVVNSDGVVLTPDQINAASQAQSAEKQTDTMYAGFDPSSQTVGTYTSLDAIHDSTILQGKKSENPVDPNWGGVRYSQDSVDAGNYIANVVTKPTYFNQTSVSYIPGLGNRNPPFNYF